MKRIITAALAAAISFALMADGAPKIIDSFCGYKFGSEPGKAEAMKLLASRPKPMVGWELDTKAGQPFRKCANAVLSYAPSNQKLYRVRLASDPDFTITEAAAKKELDAMVEALTAKYKGLDLVFTRSGAMHCQASVEGQRIVVQASKGRYFNPKTQTKGGKKSKAYVFSVEVKCDPKSFDAPKQSQAPVVK